jgi:hypothetical protein
VDNGDGCFVLQNVGLRVGVVGVFVIGIFVGRVLGA